MQIYYFAMCIIAIIIHCIMNNGRYGFRFSEVVKSNNEFRQYTIATLVYYIMDAFWGMLQFYDNSRLLYIVTMFCFISMAITVFFWCRYVIAYLKLNARASRILTIICCVLVLSEMVLLISNDFSHKVFVIDENGVYQVQSLRYFVLTVLMVFFMAMAIITLIIVMQKRVESRRRGITISVFSLVMMVSILGQIRHPFQPVITVGLLVGGCILHVFIREDEHEEYRHKLLEVNERLSESNKFKEKQIENFAALNKELESQMQIIQYMSNVYYSSFIIDLENDTFTEISSKKGIRDVTGVGGRAQETFNRVCDEIIEPKYVDTMREFFRLSTLNERLKDKSFITCEYEGRLSGWSQAYFIAGQRDESDKLTHVIYATRLIKDEKAREDEANAIIESLSSEYHTVFLIDKDSLTMRLVRSSGISTIKGALQLSIDLGEYDAVIEKYIDAYVEPEDRNRMRKETCSNEVISQLDGNALYSVNYLRRDEYNKVGYHQIAFANADSKKGKKQFVLGFRDIDKILKEEQQRKQELSDAKQAAEAANHSKTIFLNNMSHDIRTPMNAILGFAHLMEKNLDNPEKLTDYLSKLESSGEYMLTLINTVLDMARIDSGAVQIDEDFSDLIDEDKSAIPMFYEMIEKKHLKLTASHNVQHRYVMVDKTKTGQITVNLLSNAVKYTPEGGSIHVDISEIPCEREGYATYVLTVSDTGIGMSKEFSSHVFDYFSREHNTTESGVVGTGLGMSIVKKLVELMGGTIEVDSEPGRGTTFRVILSHKIVENPEEYLDLRTKETNISNSFEGKRVLLAEDNKLNAEISIAILEESGFMVEHAIDGIECVDMLNKAKEDYYNLILMDIQMPNMNGYQATERIRNLDNPVKSRIPIIAMTANAFEDDKQKAIDAKMNAYLSKPVNVNEMKSVISTVLSNNE